MITAHIPSGYVLARAADWSGPTMAAAIAGAVWPDADLFLFYFVDHASIHHHRYWVHIPAFTLLASALAVILAFRFAPRFLALVAAFCAGWCLHILLDAPVGGLMWEWPVSQALLSPISVPMTENPWVLSFVLHWTFSFEIAIWVAAAILFLRHRKTAGDRALL